MRELSPHCQRRKEFEGLQPDDFLITDEPAAPEDVVSALGAFPLEAACCAFVFTILERFGDDLVALINPRFSQQRKSWHRDIQGGSKVGGPSKERKLRIAFATPFKIRQSDISRQILLDLMTVKMQRNAFAHGGSMTLSLSEFFRRVMRVICFISLKVMPEEHILVVHRSGDYSGRFAEAGASADAGRGARIVVSYCACARDVRRGARHH